MRTSTFFGNTAETGNNIQTDGLVAYWDAAYKKSYTTGSLPPSTFNLASGSLTPTGSLKNDTTFITQPTSVSSWVFDGVDDYIDCETDSSLVIPNTLTVSVWVKTISTSKGILYKGPYPSSNTNGDWAIDVFGGGGAGPARVFLNNGRKITGATAINDEAWHHVAFTYNSGLGSNNVVLYIDGASDGTANFTTALNDTGGVNIGMYYNLSYELNGNIANVQIYNRSLSATDVLQNYNAQKERFGL